MKFPNAIHLISLLISLGLSARGNMILNGSFETNAAGSTRYNMANSTFNSIVGSATAFGTAEEIDLIAGNPYGSVPQNGNWKLALHTRSAAEYDAFSFSLSQPVLSGQTYVLDFYAQAVLNFTPTIGAVEVGLSNSPTSFGTTIFSGTPLSSANGWTHFSTIFLAPSNAQFLTVQTGSNFPTWDHIDNFSLAVLVPEPSAGMLLLIAVAFGGCNQESAQPGRR